MKIEKLDHVNVRTTQLDAMIEWYTKVLGMYSGDRPDFPFPGAWMYADKSAIVHLVGIDGLPAIGSESNLKLEHFAFSAVDLVAFESNLKKMGVKYSRNELASVNLIQVNVWDPDGNHIHVDFRADE